MHPALHTGCSAADLRRQSVSGADQNEDIQEGHRQRMRSLLTNPRLPVLLHSLQYQAILNYTLNHAAGDIRKISGTKKE